MLLRPRFGGYLVAARLTVADYYDIARRDFGLALAALTLARLAAAFQNARLGR